MKIVAFIEEDAAIAKILKYLDLWELPVAHSPPSLKFVRDSKDEYSQLLPPEYEYEAC
jgi:hypothetical protein